MILSHLLKQKVSFYYNNKVYPLQRINLELKGERELENEIDQLNDQLHKNRGEIIDKLDWTTIFIGSSEIKKIYRKYFGREWLYEQKELTVWETDDDHDCLENKIKLTMGMEYGYINPKDGYEIEEMIREKIPGKVVIEHIWDAEETIVLMVQLNNSQSQELFFKRMLTYPNYYCKYHNLFSEKIKDLITNDLTREGIVNIIENEVVKKLSELNIKKSDLKLFRSIYSEEIGDIIIKEKIKEIMLAVENWWKENMEVIANRISNLIEREFYPVSINFDELKKKCDLLSINGDECVCTYTSFIIPEEDFNLLKERCDLEEIDDESNYNLKEAADLAYAQIIIPGFFSIKDRYPWLDTNKIKKYSRGYYFVYE